MSYLKEIFYVLTAAILIFAGLEAVFPGMVLAYLNLNILLIFWLIVGIIIVFSNEEEKKNFN